MKMKIRTYDNITVIWYSKFKTSHTIYIIYNDIILYVIYTDNLKESHFYNNFHDPMFSFHGTYKSVKLFVFEEILKEKNDLLKRDNRLPVWAYNEIMKIYEDYKHSKTH